MTKLKLIVFSLALLSCTALAMAEEGTDLMLRGMKSFDVKMDCSASLPVPCSTLQSLAELKLRAAGIPIRAGGPELHIAVQTMSNLPAVPAWSVVITVAVFEPISSMRDPSLQILGSVWTTSSMALMGEHKVASGLRSSTEERVDEFLNAFLKQNPKTLGARLAADESTPEVKAKPEDPDMTVEAFNGRFWQKLPLAVKVGFVAGFDTVMNMRLLVTPQDRENYTVGTRNSDLVRALDDYYQRQDDLRMPIWIVIRVIKMEKDGLSSSEIDDRLAAEGILRKVVSAPLK